MTARIALVLALVCASTGCLASTIADNIQKGTAESNRHKEKEKELAIKEKEMDGKAKEKEKPADVVTPESK